LDATGPPCWREGGCFGVILVSRVGDIVLLSVNPDRLRVCPLEMAEGGG